MEEFADDIFKFDKKRAKMALDRAKMALDRSPDFLRMLLPIFFLSLSEKNLQEFLYVCTVQEASIH